jgi:hypothetical protein
MRVALKFDGSKIDPVFSSALTKFGEYATPENTSAKMIIEVSRIFIYFLPLNKSTLIFISQLITLFHCEQPVGISMIPFTSISLQDRPSPGLAADGKMTLFFNGQLRKMMELKIPSSLASIWNRVN